MSDDLATEVAKGVPDAVALWERSLAAFIERCPPERPAEAHEGDLWVNPERTELWLFTGGQWVGMRSG